MKNLLAIGKTAVFLLCLQLSGKTFTHPLTLDILFFLKDTWISKN